MHGRCHNDFACIVTELRLTEHVARFLHYPSTVNDEGERRTLQVLPRFAGRNKEMVTMLWAIVAVLLLLWLLGFIGSVGGAFIHLLLVIAAVVLIVQLLSGRRGTAL